MRSSRFVTFLLVVALFAVSPNLFARVCHPKQPITCGATTLSQPAVVSPVAKPAVKAAKQHATTTQQAMACGPWLRTFPLCSGTALTETAQPQPVQQAMACGPWLRTFPLCSGNTIASLQPLPATKPQQHAMACGPWLRTFPLCTGTTLA